MQQFNEQIFNDLLEERRKDWDILWVSRSMSPLAPHKLAPHLVYNRKQAIEATLADPKVNCAIRAVAAAKNVPVSTVMAEAQDILQEMASKAYLPTVRWIGLLITKVLKRILISIRINDSLLYRMKDQMCISQVQYIYAPTHRSYLDFILLSYILFSYDMALPNIASGMDFYRMRIVGELLRHTGAFYMRRSFGSDPLYKEIFKAYVGSLVTRSDRALEFFIEGTRSRSQKTLSPKYGLLSTILDSLYRSNVFDIQFIPISISYDKPLEELLFVYELLGVPKPAESTTGLFRSLSILREPFANGHVYVKIAPPISAREYMDYTIRGDSALSPISKLPPEITKRVAYAIVNCHKRNTVLTPFNLIALLFNERVFSHPKKPYSLEELFSDYSWIKNVLHQKFEVTINPPAANVPSTEDVGDADRHDILESLQTHKNLMEIDSNENLRLKNRHTGVSQIKGVKGHPLSEETLRISVPAINVMIYVNPVFAYLSKPSIAALCVNLPFREAVKRYLMLRSLLSIEFALSSDLTESELINEWEETNKLIKGKYSAENLNEPKVDEKLYSILCHLILPFIASLQIMCKTLQQWKNPSQCTDKNIIQECQRCTEEIMYEQSTVFKHPYSLSLDTFGCLLSSLVATENVTINEQKMYAPDRNKLSEIIVDLDDIMKQRSCGSYLDIASSLISQEMPLLQAKL